MILRDAFLNDNVFNINQLNSFGKTGIGNEQIYNQGFSLSKYLIDSFGPSILKDISEEISRPYMYSFGSAVKKATGVSLIDIYNGWYSMMEEKYMKAETIPSIDKNQIKGTVLIDEGTTSIHPVWSIDGNKFAYLSNAKKDYFGQTDLYVYDFSDSSSKKIISGVFSAPTWLNDSTIIYTKKSKPNKLNEIDVKMNSKTYIKKKLIIDV